MGNQKSGTPSRSDYAWAGIDPDTRAFILEMVASGGLPGSCHHAAREWLIACRDIGLPTDLNADLADARFAALYEQRLAAATRGIERVRRRHTRRVREGLRFYGVALTRGRRTLPVPADAVPVERERPVTMAEARLALPAEDQRKLAAADALFLELATQQWNGEGEDATYRRADGRRRKDTLAFTSQARTRGVLDEFVRQARVNEWEPFSLDEMLTPARVITFLYYTTKVDGTYYDIKTIKQNEVRLLDYLYRARTCGAEPIELISAEREAELRAAVLAEQDNRRRWFKRSPKQSNSGRHKWYPALEQVTTAIAGLEERITRLEDRWGHTRISRSEYWRELRDAVLTLCTLYGMWRVDTASTLSALHLKRFGPGNDVLDGNDYAVLVNSARAKNTSGNWYPFVEELTLTPQVVRLIKKLLAFEGRSLAQPLRAGEQPVRLRAGTKDRWGKDPVLSGELAVVPLFRAKLDQPKGLTHAGVEGILERQLRRLHFGATNPHTLRAAGAIYWSFVVGMPEAHVMRLGLWEDPATLRESYAKVNAEDQRRLMAAYLPPEVGGRPRRAHGKREQAAVAALTVLGKMLEKPTMANEARQLLAELRRSYEVIDQTIAAELGRRWEPMRPDPLLSGERERIDEELEARGCRGGIEQVIGRRLFPQSVLWELADARSAGGLPPAVRSRWELVHPRALAPHAQIREVA